MTTCTRDFAGIPEAAGQARAWATPYLTGCPNADDVVLLLSELVANAALHSRSAGGAVHVRLVITAGAWVRCEVRDDGPLFRDSDRAAAGAATAVTEPGLMDEAGRGLWLVRQLAAESGADGTGLHWFMLPWRPGTPARVPGPRAIPEDTSPGRADLEAARSRLAATCAEYASLLAACRASVAAAANQDPDPVTYVRGILEERGQLPPPGAVPRVVLADARTALHLTRWPGVS